MSTNWRRVGMAAAFTVTVSVSARASGPIVSTTGGLLEGITTAQAQEYLGIPYAAPPVGPLRWHAPLPTTWSGVLQADTLPTPCPQNGGGFGIASNNENCLYLNVYAPLSASAAKLPVMLWIHGGAFETGTGGSYDGSALVQDGVIVVTINYRLGYLGFLASPALDVESPFHASGDYGLMDQQAALRWVRQNAAAFGGDPDRITVFGESAGGQSVFDQLVSPGAAGLFQRAIIESGSYAVQLPSLATADANGVAFGKAVGCTSTTDAACLRALPISTILAQEANSSGSPSSLTQFDPDVGTAILPVQPLLAIGFGLLNRVPVLQGTNHDEARLFVAQQYDFTGHPLTASGYDAAIASLIGAPAVPLAAPLYPLSAYPTPDLAYATLFTDVGFSCAALGFDQLLSNSVPTYSYEFADEDAARLILPADPLMPLGAPHTSELPFIWPNLVGVGVPGASMTAAEDALAVQMRAAWTNFAKSGNPNGPTVDAWPAFNPIAGDFEELVPPAPTPSTGFATGHKCDFWGPVLALDGVLPPGSL